jgi:hypothetical protein
MKISPTENLTPTTPFSISFSDLSTAKTATIQIFTKDTNGRTYACKRFVGRMPSGAGTFKTVLGRNIQYFSSVQVAASIGSAAFYQTASVKTPLSNARAADGLSRMSSVCAAFQTPLDPSTERAKARSMQASRRQARARKN